MTGVGPGVGEMTGVGDGVGEMTGVMSGVGEIITCAKTLVGIAVPDANPKNTPQESANTTARRPIVIAFIFMRPLIIFIR
ncbi:MAG TPA: hypothetical protein VF829_02500 [Candidatus Paceibacterota bacterium]